MSKKYKIIITVILAIIIIPVGKIAYNEIHKEGVTPLMFASKDGDLEKIKGLIEKGVDVNEKSDYDWTALMFACWNGEEEIVKLLLESGADPNIVSKPVSSPMFATSGGHFATSALKIALDRRYNSITNILLQYNANDPISSAVLSIEEKELNRNFKNDSNVSIISAIQSEDLIDIKNLLQNGANPNVVIEKGIYLRSALGYAIKTDNNLEIVKILLENGADPNIIFINGETPFFEIISDEIYSNDLEIIELFLKYGANKNHKNKGGQTVLDVYNEMLNASTKKYNEEKDINEKDSWKNKVKYQNKIIQILNKY
ncbi:MAG: ankyrin repeat domain-containing protein [Candidatus Moranbacteria bacterium]|nr:ankyrin repeat domain-containing protein [Candidatus Moranbacteria bacterium]